MEKYLACFFEKWLMFVANEIFIKKTYFVGVNNMQHILCCILYAAYSMAAYRVQSKHTMGHRLWQNDSRTISPKKRFNRSKYFFENFWFKTFWF